MRLTSQPFEKLPSQSAQPALHRKIAQEPAAQVETAFAAEHVLPHAPQLLTLLRVSTQLAPHRTAGAVHPDRHALTEESHTGLAPEQRCPQAPQLASVPSAVSHPLLARPSQSPKPALQLATTQRPAPQPATALGSEHALPQLPQ